MRGKTITVKCERCQAPFEARIADRKRGWGRFCSRSCKAVRQEQRTGQYGNWINSQDADSHPEFSSAHQFDNTEL